jgi:ATP-dependent helicase/nuclease subunit A
MNGTAGILVDPKASLWVSAHAGSGKTRVLIDRVARLLLSGTPPDRILCLTFTKAAAAEMAMRLAQSLGTLTFAADTELTKRLGALGITEADPDLCARARTLFARALETPGGLKIQTIHAFCERLLGRFPIEAGIAPGFAVLDDRSSSELLARAQSLVLGDLAHRPSEAEQAQITLLAGLRSDFGLAQITRDLLALRRDRAGAGAPLTGLSASRDLATALGVEDGETVLDVEAAFLAGLPREMLQKAIPLLERSGTSDVERAEVFAAMLAGEAGRSRLMERYRDLFITKDGAGRGNLCAKAVQTRDPTLEPALRTEQQRVLSYCAQVRAVRAASIGKATLSIGLRVLTRYDTPKAEQAQLDYDDLVLATAALFSRTSAAWVLFKLDGGIDHILVDEAQDTNPLQWRIIAALAEEFFAGKGARERTRTIFAVGDEKQSIYRFQGADPAIFERMGTHFADKLDAMGAELHTPLMNLTRRSTRPILRVVDEIFSDPMLAKGLTSAGTPPHHALARDGQGGLVELWPTEKPIDSEAPVPWNVPLDFVHPQSPRARLAAKIATVIADWLKTGERLAAHDRAITPGDIMILVRRRDSFVDELIRALKLRHIPVAGSDRLKLTEHLAVMDLMALGAFAIMPEDDYALACLLKSPCFGVSEEVLFALAHGRKGILLDALRQTPMAETMDRIVTLGAQATPFSFYTECLGALGLRKKLVGRLGSDAEDPIDEFLRLALDYERLHPPRLQGFLHWLGAGEAEVKRDMDQGRDEVRVMTVHGAKGLEANIVFLPDTCAMPHQVHRPGFLNLAVPGTSRTAPLWCERSSEDPNAAAAARALEREAAESEHLRLLYVALTRARDRLYICGHEGKRGRLPTSWHALCEAALAKIGTQVTTACGEEGWRLDVPQTAAPDGRAANAQRDVRELGLPAHFLTSAPPEAPPGRPLSPSRLGNNEAAEHAPSPLGGDDALARFQRGRLIHKLLQFLPDRPASAWADLARKFLSQSRHKISDAAQADIADSVLRVMSDPVFAPLFAAGSRAEVPLAGRLALGGASRSIFGIVDRLTITRDRVLIIDYKTDRKPPPEIAAVPVAYRRQLAVYRALLGTLYPGHTVSCALLWTETPALMPFTASDLDATFAGLLASP